MGVMACDRNNCESIMCDRYSQEYGYICHDCMDELIATGPLTDVYAFMNSRKRNTSKDEAQARYETIFRS